MICNKCGQPVPETDYDGQVKDATVFGENFSYTGSYGSFHLNDCAEYKFSLCEYCMRHFFASFVIPPAISNYEARDEVITYEEDVEEYNKKLYQLNGKHKQDYIKGVCNAVTSCNQKAIYTTVIDFEENDMPGFIEFIYTDDALCEDHKNWACNHTIVPFKVTESGLNTPANYRHNDVLIGNHNFEMIDDGPKTERI